MQSSPIVGRVCPPLWEDSHAKGMRSEADRQGFESHGNVDWLSLIFFMNWSLYGPGTWKMHAIISKIIGALSTQSTMERSGGLGMYSQ